MNTTRFLCAIALVALAGCETTSTINTDANMYAVKEATMPLRAGERIGLVNGYSQEVKNEIGSQAGNHFMLDLRQATDTAIAMMSQHLQTMGVTVDAGAPKKMTLRVTNAKTAFQLKPFTFDSRFRTSLNITAECEGGSNTTVFAENAAVVAPMVPHETVVKRGIEGATMFAVTKLLNDARVADCMTK
jgi:hypothetical protein